MPQLMWRKSSYSGGPEGNCVEVATGPAGLVHMRESDRPGDIVTTGPDRLGALLRRIKGGEFDGLAP